VSLSVELNLIDTDTECQTGVLFESDVRRVCYLGVTLDGCAV